MSIYNHLNQKKKQKKQVEVKEGICMYNYYFASQMRLAAQNVY